MQNYHLPIVLYVVNIRRTREIDENIVTRKFHLFATENNANYGIRLSVRITYCTMKVALCNLNYSATP